MTHEAKSGWWYGRAYVDEPELSPQQYHDFFDNRPFTISFSVANAILKQRMDGNDEECVPCDELHPWYFSQIFDAVLFNEELEGTIVSRRETTDECLHWKWEPHVTDEDGQEIGFFELPDYVQRQILHNMLAKEYRSGQWEE